MKNDDGSIILVEDTDDIAIHKTPIDVYENSSLSVIEGFLEKRVQAYKNMHFSKTIQVRDSLVGIYVQDVLDNKSDDTAGELKQFIKSIKEKDIDIDINEYLKWDDIRFYNNCFDVAENSNNQYLKGFSGMIIPNLEPLMNLTFSHLDLKNARKSKYENLSSSDKAFVKKIKDLIYSDTSLSRMLKDKKYYQKNCLISTDDQEIEELRKDFGDTISYSDAIVYGYNKKVPIYLKDKNGKVFMLHEHPERTCEWEDRKEKMKVAFTTIPQLELQGLSDKEIDFVRRGFNVKSKEKTEIKKINMSPVKVDTGMEEYFEI